MPVSFSTIIVTRNRPDALALSLPLHLAQSRLPERILVVDSSDDLSTNRAMIERLASATNVSIEHQASPAGMTLQRNIGLAQISSDVVFFPDDDSLVHPEALAGMMRIYDRDTHKKIGGVCAAEAKFAPKDAFVESGVAAHGHKTSSLRARISPLRTKLEDRFFPDPMKLVARRLQESLPLAEDWLTGENAIWVEWMTGFRMSFRTEVIKKIGFNERLGRYALYEDIDAGLGVLASGSSLVAAKDAKIYHHKAPERRTEGRKMGVINILNRAYVVLRSSIVDESIRESILRHARFRVAQFAIGFKSGYGRERFSGARAALRVLPEMINTRPHQLDETYLMLRQSCLAAEVSVPKA